MSNTVNIHPSWGRLLAEEFNKDYFQEISQFLKSEIKAGKRLYPPGKLIFNAYNLTPPEKVKVVIIGQDPYHNPGQAMGLSFSVPKGVRIPPSLVNIYKEIQRDIMLPIPTHGDLTEWAKQGVFLLNAMLTVEEKNPGSHKSIGWQQFTDATISILSRNYQGIIFMLWGNFARQKGKLINASQHHILEAAHPSPLARGAYFGSKHFSKANQILKDKGEDPIDWSIK